MSDVWLIEIDENGDSLWSRSYGTPGYDYAYGICKTADNGYALTGYTNDPWQLFVLRLNQFGDSLWWHEYGGPYGERGFDIEQAVDGGFVVAGFSESFSGGYLEGYLLRIDQFGNALWDQNFARSGGGGFKDVLQLPDGGFLLGGWDGSNDAWWVRTDSAGQMSWDNWYDTGCAEAANGSVMQTSGAIAYACETGCGDMLLLQMTQSGLRQWVRFMNWGGFESAFNVHETDRNSLVLTGRTNSSDIFMSGFAGAGDSLWTRIIDTGGYEVPAASIKARDGGYIIVGNVERAPNSGQFLVIRTEIVGDNQSRIVHPTGSEQLPIFSTDTIRWTGVGFEGGVSIELNRHYPNGAWETIADSTENDGVYEWFVTDPLSDSCRIRICALADTFCDVSDGNFSIVSSQGYLALVKSNQPNAPLTSWDFGDVECPQTSAQWFRLKNFGSESIVVFQPQEPVSSEFARTTTCGAFFALAPNQMSACSVRVSFDPPADGEYSDVLRVQTDAVNGVNGFVEFGLSGAQISTPAAPQVVMTTAGLDAHLSWSAVDSSIGGCAVSDVWYAVFYSPTTGGPYYYHGWTADTTYTHAGVVNFSATMFYEVQAVDAPVAVAAELERGVRREEALLRIRNDE